MKNRALSMVLSLALVLAMFCGLGVSAYADDTVKVTMGAGDTVLGICQRLGIDFFANQAWIIRTNNITNFNSLKPGTTLTLPKGSTTTATTTTTAAGTSTTPLVGDAVAYYLVDHTMNSGETVYTVCKGMGIDYNANSDRIKSINGITNFNKVPVGSVVKLPCPTAPTGGSYKTVIAHRVNAGETVGALCQSYGIDYAKNANLIQSMSGLENLGVIHTGQTLYLPVSGSAAIGTTATAPTGTGTATGTAATGTTAPQVSTTVQPGAFTVHTSSNGVFTLQVNGQIVNSAKAGETVTVVPVPDRGYKVNDIIVYKTSTTERIPVKNSAFTMPASDITVYVTFRVG